MNKKVEKKPTEKKSDKKSKKKVPKELKPIENDTTDAIPVEKKTKVKRKIKMIPILILFVAIVLVYFLVKLVFGIKIQNIYVKGNNSLSDEYIIEKAGLKDYPSYFKNLSFIVEKRLKNDIFIKDAKVKRQFFAVINIEVEENRVLFYKVSDGLYVLENGEETNEIPFKTNPVTVVNYVPDTVYDKFVKKMSQLSEDVRTKISEIKYDPSDYDQGRFLLYMIDGNYVYVTITKFESLNYYNEIYPTLEGKKGILYLDSGNHFQEIK